MRFLLDTHVVVWAIYDPRHLSPRVAQLLRDPGNQFLFSYAAIWELLNKVGRGKLKVASGLSIKDVLSDIAEFGLTLLPISLEHIQQAASLPFIHLDPFDRMLIAQAVAEQVPLVTIDDTIWQYPVTTIWN